MQKEIIFVNDFHNIHVFAGVYTPGNIIIILLELYTFIKYVFDVETLVIGKMYEYIIILYKNVF